MHSVYFFHFLLMCVCFSCRPFTVPQILRKGNKAEEVEEGEDEDEEEERIPVLKSVFNPKHQIQHRFFFFFSPFLQLRDNFLLNINLNFTLIASNLQIFRTFYREGGEFVTNWFSW